MTVSLILIEPSQLDLCVFQRRISQERIHLHDSMWDVGEATFPSSLIHPFPAIHCQKLGLKGQSPGLK